MIAGALLDAAQTLLQKGLFFFRITCCFLGRLHFFPLFPGIHPTTISDSFQAAATEAEKILVEMSSPVDLSNDELLVKLATTSLNSKVICWLILDASE